LNVEYWVNRRLQVILPAEFYYPGSFTLSENLDEICGRGKRVMVEYLQ
jgi:hypothetical protein